MIFDICSFRNQFHFYRVFSIKEKKRFRFEMEIVGYYSFFNGFNVNNIGGRLMVNL